MAKADSGIYLRATPQVQIWDFTEAGGKWNIGADKGPAGSGTTAAGAPGKDPLVLADKPFGQWNRFFVRQIGARTTVWLNDQLVVDDASMENYWDRDSPLFAQRPDPAADPRRRDPLAKHLPPRDPLRRGNCSVCSSKMPTGFEPIFNGKDFDGWAGPVDNYEIVDGALRCKPGQGGTIFTDEEYGDFVVRLEFKLPPGGNNGLAIRYPGQGERPTSGMCELQVLDSEHPKYAKLDAAAVSRLGLRDGARRAGLSATDGRVELPGSDRHRLANSRRTQWLPDPGRGPGPGQRLHGRPPAPGQGSSAPAISASQVTPTPCSFATFRSNDWIEVDTPPRVTPNAERA